MKVRTFFGVAVACLLAASPALLFSVGGCGENRPKEPDPARPKEVPPHLYYGKQRPDPAKQPSR